METKELFDLLFKLDIKPIDQGADNRRTERIIIRLTPTEKEVIEKLAKINCLDVSNFTRWVIFKKYIDELIN